MGQEIGYCFKCQARVTSADLEKGRGIRQEGRWLCEDCAPQDAAPSADYSRSKPDIRSGTGRIPRATPPASRPGPGKNQLLWIAGGIAVVVIIAVAMLSGTPSEPARAPVERPSRQDPVPEDSPRERAAKAALAKARAVGGSDLDRQIAAYLAAIEAANGTSLQAEARETYDGLVAIRRSAYARELAASDPPLQGHLAREEFKAALELLDVLRKRRSVSDWTDLVNQKADQLRSVADTAFASLREKAADAKRRNLKADVAAVRERVKKWGLPEKADELDRFLAGVAVESDERPWRAIFDGRTIGFLNPQSKSTWAVDNGAVVQLPKGNQAAQSAANIPDGELRIRFQASGVEKLYFTVRQQDEGRYTALWNTVQFSAFEGLPCELIFTLKGDTVVATLNGQPVPLEAYSNPKREGRLQFNVTAKAFRLTALEHRPLPE